jgi:hypothetical protein
MWQGFPMRFSLPGELRGPECRRVITQAIEIRRRLDPWFSTLPSDRVAELAIVLRVGGSLGNFGPEGVENIQLADGKLACDLVVADMGWDGLSEQRIRDILGQRVKDAVEACLRLHEVPFNHEELTAHCGTGEV